MKACGEDIFGTAARISPRATRRPYCFQEYVYTQIKVVGKEKKNEGVAMEKLK